MNTKFYSLFVCFVVLMLSMSTGYGQAIFSEDFQSGIPITWEIVDGDGLTVHPNNAAFFPEAWVAGAITSGDPNIWALSTSWYEPAGQSDDWLISPAISVPDTGLHVLSWLARSISGSFPDGYEVRISTTDTDTASFGDVIYSSESENAFPTSRSELLTNYIGQTIYVAFRNTTLDGLALAIDDVEVVSQPSYDVEISRTGRMEPEYSIFPARQNIPFQTDVDVKNRGGLAAENVSLQTIVFSVGSGGIVPVAIDTLGPVPSLAPDSTVNFWNPSVYTPTDSGDYVALYAVLTTSDDLNGLNDTTIASIFVSDTTYARDIPPISRIIGIATDPLPGKIRGSKFNLNVEDKINSVTVALYPFGDNLNDVVSANVFTVNEEGVPDQLVTSSFPYIVTADDTTRTSNFLLTIVDFVFPGGPITLPAGEIFIGITEPNAWLGLGVTTDIYTPGAAFVTVDNGASWFTNQEGYDDPDTEGENEGAFVYVIRPSFNPCGVIKSSIDVQNDNGSSNGAISVTPSGGVEPYFYEWSTGQTTPSIDNLAAGNYRVTVRDSEGCYQVYRLEVLSTVSIEDQLSAGIENLKLYPNPSNGKFTVSLSLEEAERLQLKLYDLSGREVFLRKTAIGKRFEENIDVDLAPGLYMLQVETAKGRVSQKLWLR